MREAPSETAVTGGELDRLLERGWAITREMFGDEVVDARIRAMTDLARPLDEYVTAYCFGDIWARPGLTRKTRSMLTIMALIVLGREPELKGHIRGGLANGVTWDEISEIILHAAAYSGIPSAVGALRAAREVQESIGESAK